MGAKAFLKTQACSRDKNILWQDHVQLVQTDFYVGNIFLSARPIFIFSFLLPFFIRLLFSLFICVLRILSVLRGCVSEFHLFVFVYAELSKCGNV